MNGSRSRRVACCMDRTCAASAEPGKGADFGVPHTQSRRNRDCKSRVETL